MANKKQLSADAITAIFFAILIVIIIIIFATIYFVSNVSNTMKKIILLIVIWSLVFVSTIGIKATVLVGEREINNKDVVNISISSFISVFLIVGATLLLAEPTIIGRAFENTVGYNLIKGENLNTELKKLFKNGKNEEINAELDIGLIITQMFSSDDKAQFNEYIGSFNEKKPFYDMTYNNQGDIEIDTKDLYDNFVVKKYNMSMATLASLATIVAMYTCYMPMKNPWINA